MSAHFPTHVSALFRQRRRNLANAFGNDPVALFCGSAVGRNYPANVYPFRPSSHFLYFVGTGIPDAVVLMADGKCELFATAHEPDDALWHGPRPTLAQLGESLAVDATHPLANLERVLDKQFSNRPVATLPANDLGTQALQRRLLDRSWPQERWTAVDDLSELDLRLADAVIALRLSHDEGSLATIRLALEGTHAAHLAGMAVTTPGRHERDIRAAMERELIARDMVPAYNSIVTVHGEVLHNTSYQHPLVGGDMLLADVGGEYQGWASDITRTWPVSGKFSPTQQALYDIVLAANEAATLMVRPNVRYRDVHLRACRVLTEGLIDEGILVGDVDQLVERGVHAALFPHGVGHLLGLDVHDMEDLGDRAGYARGRQRSDQFGLSYLRLDRDLQPGMVVTIEPGLYIVPAILGAQEVVGQFIQEGLLRLDKLERFSDVRGIRIEDDVLCTPTGPEVLSSAIPKTRDAVCECIGRRL